MKITPVNYNYINQQNNKKQNFGALVVSFPLVKKGNQLVPIGKVPPNKKHITNLINIAKESNVVTIIPTENGTLGIIDFSKKFSDVFARLRHLYGFDQAIKASAAKMETEISNEYFDNTGALMSEGFNQKIIEGSKSIPIEELEDYLRRTN